MREDDEPLGGDPDDPPTLVDRLFMLDASEQSPYDAEELAQLLRSRLAYSVQLYLGDHNPGLAERLRKSTRGVGLPVLCLQDLVRSDDPAADLGLARADLIDLLRRVKSNAKIHHVAVSGAKLPPDLARLIYYLCIALARVHAGASISRLGSAHLHEGFTWAFGLPWVDPHVRAMFTRAQATLPLGAGWYRPW